MSYQSDFRFLAAAISIDDLNARLQHLAGSYGIVVSRVNTAREFLDQASEARNRAMWDAVVILEAAARRALQISPQPITRRR